MNSVSNRSYKGIFRSLLYLIIPFFLITTLLFSCKHEPDKVYKVIHLNSTHELEEDEGIAVFNINRNFPFSLALMNNTHDGAILARNGDLLLINLDPGIFHTYNGEDTLGIELINDGYGLVMNDALVSLYLDKDSTFSKNDLKSFDSAALHSLQDIYIEQPVLDYQLSFLERLTDLNLTPSFMVNGNEDILPFLLENFKPKSLYLDLDSINNVNIIGDFPSLKSLYLDIRKSAYMDTLPALPHLKYLMLRFNFPVPKGFFDLNPQLEEVDIKDFDNSMISELGSIDKLEFLTIYNTDSLLQLGTLDNLQNLRGLAIKIEEGSTLENLDVLQNISSLEWLCLPGNINQNDFDSVLPTLKTLQVLQLLECSDTLDLGVLSKLPALKCLEISDTLADRQSLLGLKNLEYLSIPENTYEDSTYMVELNKALPEATIVPNAGFCMGSGWLLLIIPLMLLMLFVRIKISKEN